MPLQNRFDMSGQRILISGAAGGIGSASARACAALGADLALSDIRSVDSLAEELRTFGVNVTAHRSDNTSTDDIEALVKSVGRIDAMAECSGIYASGDWTAGKSWNPLLRQLMEANVVGPSNLVRGFLPGMSEAGGGRIVILGSIAGRTAGTSAGTEPGYVVAKGAIHSLVRWLSRYCGPLQIVVNGVAPGPVKTPMNAGMSFDLDRFPLGRMADPEEIGWPVAFLCSRGASYLSGIVMDINGGTSFS